MRKFFSFSTGFGRLTAAVRWVCRVEDDARLKESSELRTWLGKNRNRQAYNRVRQTWRILDDFKSAPELLALRRQALERAQLGGPERRQSLNLVWIGAATATLLAGAVVVVFLSTMAAPTVYSTGIGERRAVVLNDNSRIWLDAATVVVVQRYSAHSRQLLLKKGRARFDVAPDKARPFSVTSGSQTTVAVGTSFDVERLNGKILVTVRQGHVLVKNAANGLKAHAPIPLSPNQRLIARGDGQIAVTSIDDETRDAWQQGKIIFDDQSLGDVAARFNRYRPDPIRVDSTIASIRISGVFNARDSSSFINVIANNFPVRAQLAANGEVVLTGKSAESLKQFAPDR
jgi:transmembrane sensor